MTTFYVSFMLLCLLLAFPASAEISNLDPNWSCSDTNKDKDGSSCCNFVPSFFEIYLSADCADYRPLLSIALGLGDTSSLSAPSAVTVSSTSYCSSVCFSRIATLNQKYSIIPLSDRLCPQVQDGLWRINLICSKDDSSNYCFESYTGIVRSLDGQYRHRVYPETLCNSSCLRVILDSSVFQASRIQFALTSVSSSSSSSSELENALRRSLALVHFSDLICSVNENGDYCATSLGLFTRSAGLFSKPLDVDDEVSVSQNDETGRRRILQGDLSSNNDVQSSDSLTKLFDPRQRPGFSCSLCGRVMTSAMSDLSEALGLITVTTASAFSISKLRSFKGVGECGSHNGMTCIETYVSNISKTSTTIAVQEVATNCKTDFRTSFSSCSSSCKTALENAREIFGCCFMTVLRLRLAESSRGGVAYDSTSTFDDDSLTRNIINKCGITPPPLCRAPTRKFFATSFANIPFAWATAFPSRIILLSEALNKDFSYFSGAPSSVFSLHSAEPYNGMTVFITGITSESNASTSQIYNLVKSSTSSSATLSRSFPHLSAAIYELSSSLTDSSIPTTLILRATDETASLAPADENIHDAEPTQVSSSAPSSFFTTNLNILLALVAAAAATTTMI